ncbi:MAG: 1-(5-phosphoribosyl)-5-[(5-phosphoribosylamino) methylideneamino]imidazole-4-carboxamide isomerase [Terriglobales bacterium]
MNGKIVQLVQGSKKVLEFDDFEEWIERFSTFPLVQLIDLDAAIGTGENQQLLQQFLSSLPCQVGGGIRTIESARKLLGMGAKRVILGSTLIRNDAINVEFAKEISDAIGPAELVFAVDAKGGKVAIRGWRELTSITPQEAIAALQPWCDAFLYTHIDTEGLMRGIPSDIVRSLRRATSKHLIVAGGISSHEEIDQLNIIGVDAVVGMALYLGKLQPATPSP